MKEYYHFVDRFAYRTLEQKEEAEKEKEAIAYIRANTDLTNVKNVYALYKKFNEKPTFKTEVGMDFMKELFDRCVSSGIITKEHMQPIKVELGNPFNIKEPMDAEEEKKRNTAAEKEYFKIATRYRNLKIVAFGLAVVIGIMFMIAKQSNYSYISDYEQKIIDKYAQWEEELTTREQKIQSMEDKMEMKKK